MKKINQFLSTIFTLSLVLALLTPANVYAAKKPSTLKKGKY